MGIILKPFAMLLMFLYNTFNSYGIALILFGLVVKLVLFPVTLKSKKSMIQMNMLSGKMNKLKAQYGKDPQRYNMEVQKLYEQEKVNPMGGCLWSLIPMFVLIGLYGIIREPLTNMMNVPSDMIETISGITGVVADKSNVYAQIGMVKAMGDPAVLASVKAALGEAGANIVPMNFSFLGMDLAAIPSYAFWKQGLPGVLMFILVAVSVVTSYISMKVSMATNQVNKQSNAQADQTSKMMMWMMPLMSVWIGFSVPAGLTVYWISQYIMTMLSEVICGKMLKKDYEAARIAAEEAERVAKIEEKQRKEEARLERARRIEEEKLNKKKGIKKPESSEPGVNKDDAREGLRAYARGRAYMPDRFGGVTPYTDPNDLLKAEAEAEAAKSKKSSKKDKEEK